MLEVLQEAGFYNEQELGLEVTDSGFRLNYSDADVGFSLSVLEGKIQLERHGSKIDGFEAWYRSFVPFMRSLISDILDELQSAFEWKSLKVLRAQMLFRMIAYDFVPTDQVEADDSVKNYRLMSRLAAGVPGKQGRIVSTEDVQWLDGMGRVDIIVSRWSKLESGCPVREVYTVEAPGNRDYSSLWLEYSIIGETPSKRRTSPSAQDAELESAEQHERQDTSPAFDFDDFMAFNGVDLFEGFFQEHFLSGFWPDLFANFDVFTTADRLP
ncbi:MAG: hypothetical protein ITG02_13380 [Patulibacter sp.]|nr:hypothetical protein [Patulibacter sp.]